MSSLIETKGVGCPEKSRRGFALVTAILAIMILLALGYLALTVTTGDLRISSRVVGEKKALTAAETGIHRMMQDFNPATMLADSVSARVGVTYQVDSATDPASRYTISSVGVPVAGPEMLPLPGYSISGGQQWGQRCYAGQVTGRNTNYDSSVRVSVGMGYGPISITTEGQ